MQELESETDGDDDHRPDQCRDPDSMLRQTAGGAAAGREVLGRRGLRCIDRALARSAFRDRLAPVARQRLGTDRALHFGERLLASGLIAGVVRFARTRHGHLDSRHRG